MKYVSIDIETTGLNPEFCQILQVGAVIEDTNNVRSIENLPKFSCLVEHDKFAGQVFALSMNAKILEKLAVMETLDKERRTEYRKVNHILSESMVAKSMFLWLTANGILPQNENLSNSQQIKITAAGKNFGTFDKLFLEKLPAWSMYIQIKQRIIDPSILFANWQEDEALPSLNTCMKRANLTDQVTHDAVQDAIDVIRVIRRATNNYDKNTQIQI